MEHVPIDLDAPLSDSRGNDVDASLAIYYLPTLDERLAIEAPRR